MLDWVSERSLDVSLSRFSALCQSAVSSYAAPLSIVSLLSAPQQHVGHLLRLQPADPESPGRTGLEGRQRRRRVRRLAAHPDPAPRLVLPDRHVRAAVSAGPAAPPAEILPGAADRSDPRLGPRHGRREENEPTSAAERRWPTLRARCRLEGEIPTPGNRRGPRRVGDSRWPTRSSSHGARWSPGRT